MQYVLDSETGELELTTEEPVQGITANGIVKLYYHHDRLSSTGFLTDNVVGKVTSYVSYDDWGAPTMKGILRMGVRELDLVTEYTGHPYDQALELYFAEARMYDAADRRFMAEDLIVGSVTDSQSLHSFLYVGNNPLLFVDYSGLEKATIKVANSSFSYTVDTDDQKSVIEMFNLFTYSTYDWNKDNPSVYAYNYKYDLWWYVGYEEGIGIQDMFKSWGLDEVKISTNGSMSLGPYPEFYYRKISCGYEIHMPDIGSEKYIDMIEYQANSYSRWAMSLEYDNEKHKYMETADRMMRDANAWRNFENIDLSDSESYAKLFSLLITKSNYITEDVHYFRNKLNRVPKSLDDVQKLVDDGTWYKVDDSKAVLHQKGDDLNYKYMSKPDGMYEAIYNSNTGSLVTDPDVMGSFNYAGGYDFEVLENLSHLTYDLIPWIKYGNTKDDPTTIEWRKQETIKGMPDGPVRWYVEREIANAGL
jgi:RHS repeat-associated protein